MEQHLIEEEEKKGDEPQKIWQNDGETFQGPGGSQALVKKDPGVPAVGNALPSGA